MKVLALIEHADCVGYRHRLEAFAWALSEMELYLEAVPLGRNRLRQTAGLVAAARADVVIVQCNLLSQWQLVALRRIAKCLICDLDSLPDASSPRELVPLRTAVRLADAVVVGNDYLRLHASAYTDPWRVHTVPTCVEPSWHQPTVHHRSNLAPKLLGIGFHASAHSQAAAAEHLTDVRRQLPRASLRTVGAHPRKDGIQDLPEADIAVSWLPESSPGLGQCGLQVLQSMAAGLPIVANPVGVHRHMVVHGQTGFLASTPSEWTDAIKFLAEDPQLRNRMAAAARQRVEEFYSIQRWQQHFANLVHATAHRLPFYSSTETAHLSATC